MSSTWFAEPKGDHTNKVIAGMINAHDESSMSEGVICEDGQPHNLWQLRDFHMVDDLNFSRRNLKLSFNIWVREGNGQIRRWFNPKPKMAAVRKGAGSNPRTAR